MTAREHGGQGAAHSTAAKNLSLWHEAMLPPHELSLLEITAAAKALAAEGVVAARDMGALRAMISELLGEEDSSPLMHTQNLCERIACCRALYEAAPTLFGEEVPTLGNQAAAKDKNAVAMLNSPIFTAALSRFQIALQGASPLFCQGFTHICEEIFSGNAAFGILPLEDSVEGKLFRLYEQIEQFELHIAYTTDVTVEADGKTVRAALLCKSEPPRKVPNGTHTLECLVYEETAHSLADFLTVASTLGLALRRVDSLPSSYLEDRFAKHVVLCADRQEIELFAAYLTLFMPRTVITAEYINI